jgi:hypothetical protein
MPLRRAWFKTNNQPQERDMADASTKVRTDRAAAERRIAALEAKRARQLLESDIATVDQTDAAIAAEKRVIAILVQREAALARADRKQARKNREADRAAALKVIAPILDQRTAWATELQEAIKRVVSLYDQINDKNQIRNAWPFSTPDYFSFGLDNLGVEILRSIRDSGGYDMLPGPVRQAIAQGGNGFTQAPADGPRPPNDLPGKVAANATFILSVLEKMQIHPPEPADEKSEAA